MLSVDVDLKPSKSLVVEPSKSVSIVNRLLLSDALKYILASSAASPPLIANSPVTSSATVGVVLPIPTLPLLETNILVEPFVSKAND